MHVQLNPKRFLERFRPVASADLEEVLREPGPRDRAARGDRPTEKRSFGPRTWRRSIAVAVPVLKVLCPGIVQLPRDQVVKTLADARTWSVELEELAPETLPMSADPKVPTKKVSLRHRGARSCSRRSTRSTSRLRRPGRVHGRSHVTCLATRAAHRTHGVRGRRRLHPVRTRWVRFECEGGTLHCVATDGRCLAHAFEEAEGTALRAAGDHDRRRRGETACADGPEEALKALAGMLATMENARLTLGFTTEGRFEVRARRTSSSRRVFSKGGFRPGRRCCRSVRRRRSGSSTRSGLQKALKDAYRFTTRESRATALTLHRSTLTISVSNDQASTSIVLPVQNDVRGSGGGGLGHDRPGLPPLPISALSRGAFVLWFPPEKHTPLLCQSEGLRYAFMPMERDEEKQALGGEGRAAEQ